MAILRILSLCCLMMVISYMDAAEYRVKADLVLLIDNSQDIGGSNWQQLKSYLQNLIRQFEVSSNWMRVACVTYSSSPTTEFTLSRHSNQNDVINAISRLQLGESQTNTSRALAYVQSEVLTNGNGDRSDAVNIVILVTNWGQNQYRYQIFSEAERLKASGAFLIMQSVGTSAERRQESARIASEPDYMFSFPVNSYNEHSRQQQTVTATIDYISSGIRSGYDIAFILDSSGSVGSMNFVLSKKAIQSIVDGLRVDGNQQSQVALITYSGGANVRFQLNRYQTRYEIIKAISEIPYNPGTTNTADALRRARDEVFRTDRGARADRKHVIVLFTDGGSNDVRETIKQATRCKMDDITILVVAIGDWIDTYEIHNVVSFPMAKNIFYVETFEDFQKYDIIRDPVKQAISNDVNYCRNNPCRNGGTCVEELTSYMCTCHQDWAGYDCDIRSPEEADVLFALDSSGVTIAEYDQTLQFIRNITSQLSSRTRVAFATFTGGINVRFNLNDFNNKRDIISNIAVKLEGQGTNYRNLLNQIRSQVFKSDRGDRSNAGNKVVLFTDGYTSDRDGTFQGSVDLHKEGIEVMIVGINVGNRYNRRDLQIMATNPDSENVMELSSTSDFGDITERLVKALSNTENECQSNPCQGGGTCVNRINKYECLCPSGRTGINCERECDGVLDIGFLVDSSGSITHEKFPEVLQFVRNVTAQLEVRDGRTRVGLVTYADGSRTQFRLDRYPDLENVLTAIELIKYNPGRTNTADGLRNIRSQLFNTNNGDRQDAPNIVIVITDGEDTVNPQDTLPQAIQAREEGIHLVVVSLGQSTMARTTLEIKGIANDPDERNVFPAPLYSDLPGLVNNVVQATCADPRVCSSRPCQNGGNCLPSVGTYWCQCPDEYSGINCNRRCTSQRDILFLLDASGSVEYKFDLEQQLTKQIIWGLNFAGSRVRVAVITWQAQERVQFYLKKYTGQLETLNAIAFTSDPSILGTNTASAIYRGINDVFRSSNGDRNGVENVMLVLSDGQSNINPQNTLPAAEQARNQNIRVLSVGIGSDVNRAEVEGIANTPSADNAFYVQNEGQIQQVADQILNQLCV